jgi:hypothetical protein
VGRELLAHPPKTLFELAAEKSRCDAVESASRPAHQATGEWKTILTSEVAEAYELAGRVHRDIGF